MYVCINQASNENIRIRDTDVPDDTELITLKRKVDNHIVDFNKYVSDSELCYTRVAIAHEKNMEAIAALTESTQGVVDAWSTASNFQKFVKWLSGFAIIGAAIAWFTDSFIRGQ